MSSKRINTNYKLKKAVPPPSTIPAVGDLIKLNVAVSFIAHRCKAPSEKLRPFRNKVSNSIRYAVKSGLLTQIAGSVFFGELMAWAKAKPRWADGLAPFPTLHNAQLNGPMPSLSTSMRGIAVPETLEACHQALIEADRRISLLTEHLNAAERRLEDQLPLVEIGLRMKRQKRKW